MQEIWKDIEWYNWHYKISNIWNLKSFKNWRYWIWKERLLKWGRYCKYYLQIRLNWKLFSLHRLVAQHFIPNPFNLPCVCHKDETLDKNGLLYNGEDNLFWGTKKDNAVDRNNKWRWFCFFKWRKNTWNKKWEKSFSAKKVNQYTKDWVLIKEYWCILNACLELWVHHWNISECCNLKRKTAWGFIWRYV